MDRKVGNTLQIHTVITWLWNPHRTAFSNTLASRLSESICTDLKPYAKAWGSVSSLHTPSPPFRFHFGLTTDTHSERKQIRSNPGVHSNLLHLYFQLDLQIPGLAQKSNSGKSVVARLEPTTFWVLARYFNTQTIVSRIYSILLYLFYILLVHFKEHKLLCKV